jgi:hypothetical protein
MINTIYGPKYLTVFSSYGKVMNMFTTTYFIGIYLYNTVPPYDITHISIDPILPHNIYNNSNNNHQWYNKHTNYYIIPNSCILYNNDSLIISLDSSSSSLSKSYIIHLNVKKLISTMMKINSNIIDEMFVHQTYSNKLTPHYQSINYYIHNIYQYNQYKSYIINEFKLNGNIRNPTISMITINNINTIILLTCLPYNFIRWGSFLCQYTLNNPWLLYNGINILSTVNDTKVINKEDNNDDS